MFSCVCARRKGMTTGCMTISNPRSSDKYCKNTKTEQHPNGKQQKTKENANKTKTHKTRGNTHTTATKRCKRRPVSSSWRCADLLRSPPPDYWTAPPIGTPPLLCPAGSYLRTLSLSVILLPEKNISRCNWVSKNWKTKINNMFSKRHETNAREGYSTTLANTNGNAQCNSSLAAIN